MNRRTPPTPSSFDPALGLELEMVVAHATTGHSVSVDRYFPSLYEGLTAAAAPGAAVTRVALEDRCVAVCTPDAEYGLDNGFNLLETSTRPLRHSQGGLLQLARQTDAGLAHVLAALQADNAVVLNASQHPCCRRDAQWYAQTCVPRPIYRELVGYRGWRHWAGIDAKAQNGANVQVPVADATRALNVMIGLAAAHIALFANSPLESGRETGLKETRLTMWPRVFEGSRFPGDAMLADCPPRPFTDLGDYFRWMFRPGTVSRSLPLGGGHDYKAAPSVLLEGDPSLSAFLASSTWSGWRTDTGERVDIQPDSTHFEHSQIAQFMDARLRYRFTHLPPLGELLRAWHTPKGLEAVFEAHGADTYIEGRGPGAGFPDPVLLAEAGTDVSAAVIMGPIALQWGLLQRLDDAEHLMAGWSWRALRALRNRAMRFSVHDAEVAALCREVLAIARDGLAPAERRLLAYADYVLTTGRCGADRMLDTWQSGAGGTDARLARVVERHRVIPAGAAPAYS